MYFNFFKLFKKCFSNGVIFHDKIRLDRDYICLAKHGRLITLSDCMLANHPLVWESQDVYGSMNHPNVAWLTIDQFK